MRDCDLCQNVGGRVLWRNGVLRIVRVEEPGYAGYLRVILHAHVGEMSDLPQGQQLEVFSAVMAAERVLRSLLRPAKINLASLGNMTPHVHWHVVARFGDDPHFPGSVWGPVQRDVHAPCLMPEDQQIRAALMAELGSDEIHPESAPVIR